jgi:2'-5' RNA ligase
MDSIQTIYDSLWQRSIESFRGNKFQLDDHLNNREQDHRRGLTIIGRLGCETVTKLSDFLTESKLIEPNQHYYERDDIHITILSIITCFDGFNIESIDREAYIDQITKSIKGEGPIRILFKGITASPSCIMVQGFPMDDRLKLLRQKLRDNFRNSPLESSMDKRYTLETSHSTIVRFKNPIANNNLFIDCLNKYRNYDFGVSEIDKIEFVYNDWYMTNSIVSKIKTFNLEHMFALRSIL